MADTGTYYRTKISFVVLSERPIDTDNLDTIIYDTIIYNCDEGDCVLHSTGFETQEQTAEQMQVLLTEAGSDPTFFMLDGA